MSRNCEHARQLASAELDGELSELERVRLDAHAAGCPACLAFRAAVGEATALVRTAPRERFRVEATFRRPRRLVGLRIAPAVAAMAVSAVGLGSIFAAGHISPVSEISSSQPSAPAKALGAYPSRNGPVNLSMLNVLRTSATPSVASVDPSRVQRPVRGGVVLK